MRFAYLAPVALGLLLVGCGPDEPDEINPPPATMQQPAPVDNTLRDSENPSTNQVNPPHTDTGSGLGTSSGAGTEPNPSAPTQQ